MRLAARPTAPILPPGRLGGHDGTSPAYADSAPARTAFAGGGGVAWAGCPAQALTRSGHGDFHHPAPPPARLVVASPERHGDTGDRYLQEFRLHVIAASRRRPCCPPEARTDTGRLRSTGSRSPALPRRRRYYAALRLPCPLQPPLRFPLRATCHGSDASSWPPRACIRERAARRRIVEPGLRAMCPVYRRGETGVSQVTWPSSSPAPRSTTPPGTSPPRPIGAATLLPSGMG